MLLDIERPMGGAVAGPSSSVWTLLMRREVDSRLSRPRGADEPGERACLPSSVESLVRFPVLLFSAEGLALGFARLARRASRRLVRRVLCRRAKPSGSWVVVLCWCDSTGVPSSAAPFGWGTFACSAVCCLRSCSSDSARQSSVRLRQTLSAFRRDCLSDEL